MIDVRKNEEKEFHDILRDGAFGQRWSPELEETIQRNPLWANMKYYCVERKSRQLVLDWFSDNCREKRVLDYCCGNGDDSFVIVKNGASEVVGIDLSEISIENCKTRARIEAKENLASFLVMDAEHLTFDDNYFDIITEYGVLHHLVLEKAYSELSRVLAPDGKCICVETLGHNPLIHLYRKATPNLRTQWEVAHILRKKDVELARRFFGKVEVLGFYHLFSLAAVPFRNSRAFKFILPMMEALDSVILRSPLLKWQAWQAVFTLSVPRVGPQ